MLQPIALGKCAFPIECLQRTHFGAKGMVFQNSYTVFYGCAVFYQFPLCYCLFLDISYCLPILV